MKKISILALISILFLGISSCKKDKDNGPEFYFEYENQKYELNNGYMMYYGSNMNGSYDYDVFLVSTGIQYSQSQSDFLGTGNLLYIDLNTSSEAGLINGTYNYSTDREAFTFVDGNAGMDVNLSALLEGTYVEFVGGSVDIQVENNVTTIDFNLTTASNKTVTGHFSGSLSLL